MEKMLVVGIAGGTGSGKSTITEIISEKFGEQVSVMLHDDYYKANHHMPYEERAKINYDCPDAFETELMVQHIRQLKEGKSIECPVYDYKIHDRSDEVRQVFPEKVLLIDGILVLAEPELRALMDIKIYVDTDADIRILRRIKRDVHQRKRTLDSVIDQYLSTVKPMHEAFVEPSKRYADIIIPVGGHNTVAMEMLEKRIASHVLKKDS